jgi:hypothetical protein
MQKGLQKAAVSRIKEGKACWRPERLLVTLALARALAVMRRSPSLPVSSLRYSTKSLVGQIASGTVIGTVMALRMVILLWLMWRRTCRREARRPPSIWRFTVRLAENAEAARLKAETSKLEAEQAEAKAATGGATAKRVATQKRLVADKVGEAADKEGEAAAAHAAVMARKQERAAKKEAARLEWIAQQGSGESAR